MQCDVCRNVIEDTKYRQFVICRGQDKDQVNICTKCIQAANMKAGPAGMITEKGPMPMPVLVFPGRDVVAKKNAVEMGWELNADDGVSITEHWKKAVSNYWFGRDGQWHRSLEISIHECFRRSCRNIREYYAMWLIRKK